MTIAWQLSRPIEKMIIEGQFNGLPLMRKRARQSGGLRMLPPPAATARILGLPTSDLDAELISKELRQKYGKKENRSVMHPGGRQRFLLNQTEKAPMKRGGKAEASKSDMQQDRALMARHNRLMHPDQKSKMKNGGKSVPSYSSKPLIKKSGGGNYNY